ncbi:MAG: hypothetical protein ACOX2F_07925 [bacterium]
MIKSKVGESAKQKLFLVYFNDGYIKPVIATSSNHAKEIIVKENERKIEDIERIVLEQNYYPPNEDYFDI